MKKLQFLLISACMMICACGGTKADNSSDKDPNKTQDADKAPVVESKAEPQTPNDGRTYLDAMSMGYYGNVKSVKEEDSEIFLAFNKDGSISKFYEYDIKDPNGKTPIVKPGWNEDQAITITRNDDKMIALIERGNGYEGDYYSFEYNDDKTISIRDYTFLGGAWTEIKTDWENGKLVKWTWTSGCEGGDEEEEPSVVTYSKYDSHNNPIEKGVTIEYWD